MNKPITELWMDWREGKYTPANDRERLILELWTAFLDKDMFDYEQWMTVPVLLEKLWANA